MKLLKIGYLNDIYEFSKNSGILIGKIKSFIKHNNLTNYDDKLVFYDLEKLCKYFKIDYVLLSICNICDTIKSASNSYIIKNLCYTIAFFGHVNHGKTTLIKKLINKEIIETYEITQKVDVYKNNDLYLIDVPGHDIFYPVRENLVYFMNVIVIVISLHKGIEVETKKILQFFVEENLFYKCIISFTKYDIKQYEIADIIQEIYNVYNVKLDYFLNTLSTKEIYKTLYNFSTLTMEDTDDYLFDGLILRKDIIDGSIYNLLKLNKGTLDRKSFLLSENKICRVTKIKDIIKFKDVVQACAIGYYYVCLDINMDEYSKFYISKNQDHIYEYDKYLTAIYYMKTFVINKAKNSSNFTKSKVKETISEKRYRRKMKRLNNSKNIIYKSISSVANNAIIVDNSMTTIAITNLLNEKKLDKEYRVLCTNDSNSNLYLMDCKKIIYFCCQKKSDVQYSGIIEKIDNIYDLVNSIDCAIDSVKDNKFVVNCAKITHIFNVKGVVIAGCLMIKGTFVMKDKIMVTTKVDENNNYILQESVKSSIISLKKNTNFVKKVKLNDQFGITLENCACVLKVDMYIYMRNL